VAAPGDKFVSLAGHVCLRLLETPCLYDRRQDDLYELNNEGLEALKLCRGHLRLAQVALEPEFQEFCLAEGLLVLHDEPRPRPLVLGPGPLPSLRYLELQITWRCNLACRHCYLGAARGVDLPVARVAALLKEFEDLNGLRVLISGGEPLMHPAWEQINALLSAAGVRRVLLSNGLLLDDQRLAGLNCDEVQISLDGMPAGHELLRGPGSFAGALEAARRVRGAGLDLSIANQVHAGNLGQFAEMAALVEELGAREWGIDAPCLAGRLSQHPDLAVSPEQAAKAMAHAFGGSYHGSGVGQEGQAMACGLHLATVAADGRVAQCGFYLDQPLGRAEEGLWTCWDRREPGELASVQGCRDCPAALDCGGGCRFRAASPDRPDPVMCAAMEQPPP
jgi:radical SAM protein with 4Fe4S-binding SPASM domain